MREYAKVAPTFWTGTTGRQIRAAGYEARIVATYLMTAPSSTMLGLYYLPIPTLCHETGIPPKGARKALRSLSEAGFCFYDDPTETVFVVEMASYQVGDALAPNDNRVKGIRKEVEALRKCPLYRMFWERYGEAFHFADLSPSEGASGVPSKALRSQEQEQEQEQEEEKENPREATKPALDSWFESDFEPAYPEHRRVQHRTALSELRKLKPDDALRAEILARLARWRASHEWTKSAGEYVPGMGKFFSDGWWKREPGANGHGGSNGGGTPGPKRTTPGAAAGTRDGWDDEKQLDLARH